MKHSLVGFLLVALITTVSCKNVFPNEIIVTSADVIKGEIKNIGTTGEKYRMYAVYAIGSEDAFSKQVSIFDGKGTTYYLNDLCNTGGKFLSMDNIVEGPVTVLDPTENQLRRKRSVSTRFAYTIYLVSTKVPAFLVVDVIGSVAQGTLESDDYEGKEVKGMTILSADARFSLRSFQFTADSAYLIPRGYDLQSSGVKDSILDLTQQNAFSSYVTIFGPIVTILNTDQTKTGRFIIGFDPVSSSGPLDPGSSLSLLSPNWLSFDESYSTSYKSYSEAFDRQFDYGEDTHIDFALSVSSLTDGESVTIDMTDEKGAQTSFRYDTPIAKGSLTGSFYGRTLHLGVTVADLANPTTYPRFVAKITSSGQTPPNQKTTTTKNTVESTTSGTEGATRFIAALLLMCVMLVN